MKIAIIGGGNVGGALAFRWALASHQVAIGARAPQSEKVVQLTAKHANIKAMNIPEAAKFAEILLFATPAKVIPQITPHLGKLNDKIIIDATNTIGPGPAPYANGFEALSALTNAKAVIKCFNTTGYENMLDPNFGDTKADMFLAGADNNAKKIVEKLALDVGFGQVYDLGGAEKAALLEQLAMVWINLAIVQGYGRDIAIKIIKR